MLAILQYSSTLDEHGAEEVRWDVGQQRDRDEGRHAEHEDDGGTEQAVRHPGARRELRRRDDVRASEPAEDTWLSIYTINSICFLNSTKLGFRRRRAWEIFQPAFISCTGPGGTIFSTWYRHRSNFILKARRGWAVATHSLSAASRYYNLTGVRVHEMNETNMVVAPPPPPEISVLLIGGVSAHVVTAAALAGSLPNLSDVKFCKVSEWLRDSRQISVNDPKISGGQS